MSKSIDAEKLKAEIINRMMSVNLEELGNFGCHRVWAYNDVKDLITSLQQEQPELPGIEGPGIPGKDFIPVEWVDACEMYGKWKIVKQELPEVDLEKEIERIVENEERFMKFQVKEQLIKYVARHFAEWGAIHLNARKEE